MGMPMISPSTTTRDQAISDMIQSIALEQAALAHILNAEGEKIQRVVAMCHIPVAQLIETNSSVESMVNAIERLETVLHAKLELFKECLCECHDWPTNAENS